MSGFLNLLLLLFVVISVRSETDESSTIPDEKWGYVDVRRHAHMFWWSFGALNKPQRNNLPLILWLQGGPGASSTGFGNFQEIGPYDTQGRARSTTWLKKANLLFIDNPVGAGFSYVDNQQALTTDVAQISEDLFVLFAAVLKNIPAFRHTPFYIFAESYGGKMAAAFGERLHQGIQSGQIDCNFKGVGLGDSWISPIDFVMSWGQYLQAFSLLDKKDLEIVTRHANIVKQAVDSGRWRIATAHWGETENIIDRVTDGVSFYNVLKHSGRGYLNTTNDVLEKLYQKHVAVYNQESLSHFMNTQIRRKLGIPAHVQWGGQMGAVFRAQGGDFMKPVISTVDKLIAWNYKVVVFEGQLDLICDTLGAESWVSKLSWSKLGAYQSMKRRALYTRSVGGHTQGFVKSYENFSFYYILNAGHMAPADNPEMCLEMLDMVLNSH